MCFGIPMRVSQIDGLLARCEARGVLRDASLLMIGEDRVQVGDYVAVHLGQVIEVLTEQQARDAWEIYDEMLSAGS